MPTPAETALLDQAHAATDHAAGILHQLADLTGQPCASPEQPSRWLAAQLRALQHALTSGTARVCPHVLQSPRLMHAVAWQPGVIACTACASALRPVGTEDFTCDRCHTIGPVHSSLTAIGPVLFGYGLCTPCVNATRDNLQESHP